MKDKRIFYYMFVVLIIIALMIVIMTDTQSLAEMAHYQKVSFSSGMVKADILNVRLGPGMNFPVVCKVYQGEIIRIFAKINQWYIIQNQNNCVGMVREDYIKPFSSTSNSSENEEKIKSSNSLSEEQELLNLVNQERKKAGVQLLKTEDTLVKTAGAKAEDMVNGNYFSHNSPTYGSPFDMMKKYGVKYRAAGENIAGNSTVKGAFNAWMKSESHRKNMLDKNFNYTGIGIVQSKKYGKVLVQQFIGR